MSDRRVNSISSMNYFDKLKKMLEDKSELDSTNQTNSQKYKSITNQIKKLTEQLSDKDLSVIEKLNKQEIDNLNLFLKASSDKNEYMLNKLNINHTITDIIETKQKNAKQSRSMGR